MARKKSPAEPAIQQRIQRLERIDFVCQQMDAVFQK